MSSHSTEVHQFNPRQKLGSNGNHRSQAMGLKSWMGDVQGDPEQTLSLEDGPLWSPTCDPGQCWASEPRVSPYSVLADSPLLDRIGPWCEMHRGLGHIRIDVHCLLSRSLWHRHGSYISYCGPAGRRRLYSWHVRFSTQWLRQDWLGAPHYAVRVWMSTCHHQSRGQIAMIANDS